MKMQPVISVVIPTYRRDDLLRRCLEKVLAQSLESHRYEVVVCDDGPADSTRQLVESLYREGGPTLRYLPITATQGPAGARNAGWRAARGEIIAFTDDDCLPESGWLVAGWEALAEADAATGRTVVPVSERPTDFELDTLGLASAEFITANCFVRREALEAVGGFDERFTSAWREDSDLQFSLLEQGRWIVRAEGAIVVHPVRPAAWGISLKQQKKGVFDPLLRQKHPELYRQRVFPFPWQYLVINAALATTIVGALSGSLMLAFAGLAVWLVFTLEFAWRRLRRASHSPSHVSEMLVTSALIPPISLYWRLRGLWRYRHIERWEAGAVRPTLNTVSR